MWLLVGGDLYNRSIISHCLSFAFPPSIPVLYHNMLILSFFIVERPIFEASTVFRDTQFFAVSCVYLIPLPVSYLYVSHGVFVRLDEDRLRQSL